MYLKTIKNTPLKYIKMQNTVENLFGDGLAEVTSFDFSQANSCIEARIEAVTLVAAACYANPNAVGRETLFNRLEQESLGLPSSSFEFVPVLLNKEAFTDIFNKVWTIDKESVPNILVFGEVVHNGEYLLTNYRALCADYELTKDKYPENDYRLIFNNEEECYLIGKYYKVFLSYIDTNTRTQYIRHRRANWQEMSRRYVSGKKVEIQCYISEQLRDVSSEYSTGEHKHTITTSDLEQICIAHYNAALVQGVAPQEARRWLPQAMYTLVWSGFTPKSLKNFFDLRLDKHSQYEIRKLAEAKLELTGGKV